jgi:hypothetical protein
MFFFFFTDDLILIFFSPAGYRTPIQLLVPTAIRSLHALGRTPKCIVRLLLSYGGYLMRIKYISLYGYTATSTCNKCCLNWITITYYCVRLTKIMIKRIELLYDVYLNGQRSIGYMFFFLILNTKKILCVH